MRRHIKNRLVITILLLNPISLTSCQNLDDGARSVEKETVVSKNVAMDMSADGQPISSQRDSLTVRSPRVTENVTECDKLAAHSADPTAVSTGIADEQIDAVSAIAACKSALKVDGESPRLKFQLARGYLKAGHIEEATEQFVTAAESGHGGALAYLGDLHIGGAPGIEADPILARSLYQKAVEAGFSPAKSVLDQFEDKTEEFAQADETGQGSSSVSQSDGASDDYISSSIVNAIYEKSFSAIPDDLETRRYIVSLLKAFIDNCGQAPDKVAIAALRYASPEYRQMETNPMYSFKVMGDTLKAMSSGGAAGLARLENQRAIFRMEGIQDGTLFIQTYGCQGKESSKFQNNLHSLILGRSHEEIGPRADGRHDNLEQTCLSAYSNGPLDKRIPERLRGQYCSCAASRLEKSLTPSEKTMLLQDFDKLGKLMQEQRRDLLPYISACNI